MTEKAPYTPAPKLSEAEQALREKLDTLEFPRMLCTADGSQTRVESKAEAEAALKAGLTLLPTAPDPHDGGTPNIDPATVLPPGIAKAIASAVEAAQPVAPAATVPHPPMVTHTTPKPVEDDDDEDDNGKGKKKR